jgi:uncharacterized membrane protein
VGDTIKEELVEITVLEVVPSYHLYVAPLTFDTALSVVLLPAQIVGDVGLICNVAVFVTVTVTSNVWLEPQVVAITW